MFASPHKLLLIFGIALAALLSVPVLAVECDVELIFTGDRAPDVRCSPIVTVAIDQEDRLWRLWANGQQLYVDFSSDRGHSYVTPMAVNAQPEPINTDPENRPRLGVFGDHLVVIWARPGEKRFTSDLRISRSADAGKTFSDPENVNRDGLEIGHSFADLSVGPNGDLLIAWLDGRDRHHHDRYHAGQAGEPFTGTSLYFTRADAPDQPLQPEQSIARGSCECCRLAMDRDADGSPLVLWRHIFDGNIRDHAMGVWRNGEFAWKRSSFEDWQIEACPHHGPAMAVGDVRIHAAWFSAAEHARGLFYRSFDLDFADTTTEPAPYANRVMPFGDPSRLPSRPALAVNGSEVMLAWQEFDGEQTHVLTRHSTDHGVTWSDPVSMAAAPGAVDHPQLLVLDDNILLSWQVPGTGHALVELAR